MVYLSGTTKVRGFLPFLFGLACFHVWIHATVTAPVYELQSSTFFVFSVSSGTLLAALLLIVCLWRSVLRVIGQLPWLLTCVILSTLGTLLMSANLPLLPATQGLTIIATALTALGTGGFLAVWGEAYTRIGLASSQVVATFAALVVSFFLYFFTSAFPEMPALSMTMVFPLISALCLRYVLRLPRVQHESPPSPENPRIGLPFKLLIYIFAFSVPLNLLNEQISAHGNVLHLGNAALVYSCALLVMVAAFIGELIFHRQKIALLSFLTVILATGSLLLSLFSQNPGNIAITVFEYSGYFLFIATFYSHLGVIASKSRRPAFFVFAIGNAVNVLGLLAGTFFGFVAGGLGAPWSSIFTIVVIYALFFVGLYLVPQSRQNIFMATELRTLAPSNSTPTLAQCVEDNCRIVARNTGLTTREEEILNYLVRGRSVQSIAQLSQLSQNTVKTHSAHIYHKLNVHTREELIVMVEKFSSEPPDVE